MKKTFLTMAGLSVVWVAASCASRPSADELDQQTLAMLKASFRNEGIASTDRLNQDLGQKACSSDQAPTAAVSAKIETEAMASIVWPSGGKYLGDWREGEKLAQNGRGMTWTDRSVAPSANGANCYNCHQITKQEVSFGTLGPSLYHYGKLRGVSNPADPASAAIVRYTWGKLWNSKAYSACSNMPRFGHAQLLNEAQIQHLMALLLDPKSPVNDY